MIHHYARLTCRPELKYRQKALKIIMCTWFNLIDIIFCNILDTTQIIYLSKFATTSNVNENAKKKMRLKKRRL